MTNIIISIDDETYEKMHRHSEVKWKEFVERCVKKRVKQLENLNENDSDNLGFLGDENLLAESWSSKEDEEAFQYLQ